MATQETSFEPGHATLASDSHDTALCIVPPRHIWASIDRLRALYDKGYEKWPPHINVQYPFVESDDLSKAAGLILSHLRAQGQTPFNVGLDAADAFPHRHDNTIFIKDSDESRSSQLQSLRSTILESLGLPQSSYQPHMTVGQTEDIQSAWHHFLLQKANFLPAFQWEVDELSILLRERRHVDGKVTSEMKLWGSINLRDFTFTRSADPRPFYDPENTAGSSTEYEAVTETGSLSRYPLEFTHQGKWEPARSQDTEKEQPQAASTLAVASYNVLAEFEYPPSPSRYPTVVRNMLERSALADVLVLQEVTDDFLCYLLRDDRIRKHYPFTTCGPPDQADMEPLPSHLSVVVLSKRLFTWDWVSFRRKHKGAVVIQFDRVGKMEEDVFIPVILAAVHLTCGLTDGSVATKKIELQAILNYLSNYHAPNPWVLAGDFNITTSIYTIENALKKKAISPQTANYLNQMDTMFSESGLSDTWTLARLENVDSSWVDAELFEGEGGATFDPSTNVLAAEIVGSGFNNRPQRYDRILVKDRDFFSVVDFNMFGQSPGGHAHRGEALEQDPAIPEGLSVTPGSDHWGIRCCLKLIPEANDGSAEDMARLMVPVQLRASPRSLSDSAELKSALDERGIFPTETEMQQREQALGLLRSVLQDSDNDGPKLSMVVVPVGSYGLGVWTAASDVDCLAIGPINSRIFFALATQRLRKAASSDIKILRRVQAHSGTMLELEVRGIKMDLQYCPSTYIAETWPQAMSLPANSPVFSLSTQTLAKLKPIRDLFYMRRTIPEIAAFRTAYHLIKAWAKQRGIYAGKFGYLNGIQISVMLSRVCKLLSSDGASVAVPAILTTFFHHYANFDWGRKMVFDPFFHKRLRYVRTAREPLAILGFHSPNLNTALAASVPSVRTIAEEFRRADKTLSEEGITWSAFLGNQCSGAEAGEFLQAYKSYVKIDAQFWGVSLAKGSQFVGWLESRCVMLLVDLGRRLPKLHARIWPKRFVDMESSREEKDYQGYYLIGLDWLESAAPATMSKEDAKIALGSLQTALQKFEEQIQGDEKYFDAKTCWMSASVVRQTELGGLKADDREWGEYTMGDDISDEEDEEEDDLVDDDDAGSETERPKAKSKRSVRKTVDRPAYEGKFRPSADVINRIRWDPEMDSGDFIVGYEDRFLGAKERALDLWKSEQTDEEFIPQHRILYFKRKSDGVVVWDRKARIDTVFGTGVSSNHK